jgi:multicomponent Na+:H+ antiporter subunit A
MAGIPTSFGFVAKDVITAAKSDADVFLLVSLGTVVVSAVSVAVAAVAAIRIFWGRPQGAGESPPHEAHWSMLVPPLLIALLGLAFGLAPTWVDPLMLSTAQAMAPTADITALVSPWYAMTGPVLATQILALLIGLLIYAGWDKLHRAMDYLKPLDYVGPTAWYQKKLKAIPYLAAATTRFLQHGKLSHYAALLIAFMSVVIIVLLFQALQNHAPWPTWQPVSWPATLALTLVIVGAVSSVLLPAKLLLVLASGLVGYGSALFFLFTAAPDLAFTQFSIETVLVVVAVATLLHLSRTGVAPVRQSFRFWRAGIALAFGAVFAGVFMFSTAPEMQTVLADFFGQKSLAEAYGKNVVNVIIVDFRALDTLGEIAVVALALLAALPLLRGLKTLRQDMPVEQGK